MATARRKQAADGRFAASPDADGARPISPTDVSQYIRLDQCRRYLRLRLHERVAGSRFLRDAGVAPQAIQPLLTHSGATFEAAVTEAIRGRFATVDLAAGTDAKTRAADNARVVEIARWLPAGETVVLFQPRLEVTIGGWRIRGDADVVRLERDSAVLRALIADVKSSTVAKVEHRLQVAFYHELLAALFAEAAMPEVAIETAILYRGPADPTGDESTADARRIAAEREAATRLLNVPDARLEIVPDPEGYRGAVRDLVTGPRSVAEQVADAPFDDLPFHLTYKCDGCLYNEFCLKRAAIQDDLSLLPHLSEHEKAALRRAGVTTVRQVAHLKEPRRDPATGAEDLTDLVAAPGAEALVKALAATWPVGPRLDELVHRARAYRRSKREPISALRSIPSKGYGSLPYCAPDHNPNLVRVYLDAQHDYLHDRVYLLGALVVAAEHGQEQPRRRRSIVHLTDGPPATPEAERALLVGWIDGTIRAIVELAAPDEDGAPRAPIHLVFFNRFEQRILLDALGRHAGSVLRATPLYDFITQLAAFDSPVATFLDEEIRELKNYPMVCQSLQAVAAYLGFDWNAATPYRELFRERLFDFWDRLDRTGEALPGESPWYTRRARFGSQIPLEYAYAAWNDLPPVVPGERDNYAPYRAATPDLLRGFQARRLEAIERIAQDFPGNRQTQKQSFDLPDLGSFAHKARDLAQALAEFLAIERHVYLGAWKRARLPAPERRVLAGDTLVVRYEENDQKPGVAETNRENERRRLLREEQRAAWRVAHPEARQVRLPKEEREASAWSQEGLRLALRIDLTDVDADLDEVMGLTKLRAGNSVVLYPRWTVDGRLPEAERVEFQPTPRQMLYGQRATIAGFRIERDGGGRAVAGFVEVDLQDERQGDGRGYVFGSRPQPPAAGRRYTIDEDPNNWYGAWLATVVAGIGAGGRNTLHERLTGLAPAGADWPPEAVAGQTRFLAGLDALNAAGALHGFEEGKRLFIGDHGETPTLLVQGPPGTGKSYSTAFALFARLQGAMAAGIDFRVIVSCKTHAATDVLLEQVVAVQRKLIELGRAWPAIFAEFFDDRLLAVPLFRIRPREGVPAGAIPLHGRDDRSPDQPPIVEAIAAAQWCVAAATPGGVYGAVKERWGTKELFGHDLIDCLVLDEASQLNLPEAIMAALLLEPRGQLIVVGDHRQMPPIVHHDWANETRRTFREYRTYDSLFDTLRLVAETGDGGPPIVRFAESFRLHAEMAEFLRREVYARDGIPYHSKRADLLPTQARGDAMVDAILAPEHPLVVVVHGEAASQQRNRFEQRLIAPVLEALAASDFDAVEGLGVVVPHRAQRAALQEAVPTLTARDPETGAVVLSAVDTIERFQGGERTVVVVSATESDPAYLLAQSAFLLDPRRLTVALSRAKRKMVLVAARSVFELFSPDEETFRNAQLWKNLLRRTCVVPLWRGEVEGTAVEIWGNRPATESR